MGGGDLNLKKSWHPSTMKNMEKVWKAEQQDHEEKRKIAQLKREIEMERDKEDITAYAMEQGVIAKKEDKKLDWMYKGPNNTVDREDYLLGKAIDKTFEQTVQAEKNAELNRIPKNHVEYECIPPSLRYFSGTEQVDLARKLQEDPLYAIKKKEIESRTQLLKNPVKLKQLKQLLEQQAKKSKSDKKVKKKKKEKHNSTTDEDSDDNLDALLASKYKKLKDKISRKELLEKLRKSKKEKKRKRCSSSSSSSNSSNSSSSSSSSSDDSDDSNSDTNKKRKRKYRSQSPEEEQKRKYENKYDKRGNSGKVCEHSKRKTSEIGLSGKKRKHSDKISTSRNKETGKKNGYRKSEKLHNISQNKRERSKSPKCYDRNDISSRDKTETTNYGLMRADGTKVLASSKKPSPVKLMSKEVKKEDKRYVPHKKSKLTDEEKERRRKEMMENALWRDKVRTKNVQRYRDEEKKEQEKTKIYNKDFVRKHLAAAAEVGSLESRIKSNMNNIQRSKHAMDSNFAKR